MVQRMRLGIGQGEAPEMLSGVNCGFFKSVLEEVVAADAGADAAEDSGQSDVADLQPALMGIVGKMVVREACVKRLENEGHIVAVDLFAARRRAGEDVHDVAAADGAYRKSERVEEPMLVRRDVEVRRREMRDLVGNLFESACWCRACHIFPVISPAFSEGKLWAIGRFLFFMLTG